MNTTPLKKEYEELTPYEKQVIIFGLKCVGSELSKILIFSIIFSHLGFFFEFLIALSFMMLYRTTSGGLHFHSYIICFCVSFLFLFLSINLAVHLPVPYSLRILIAIFCCFAGYALSPVQAPSRPPLEASLKKRGKKRVFLLLCLFLLFSIISSHTVYANIGFYVTVIHILQLLVAYIYVPYRKP